MLYQLSNTRFIMPFAADVELSVSKLDDTIDRNALTTTTGLNNETSMELSFVPEVLTNVSIFVDGFRLVNSTRDFGQSWSSYEVNDNVVTFYEPVVGNVEVVYDLPFYWDLPDNITSLNNVQGAARKASSPGELYAGTRCEPVILTQAHNGFARLSNDRSEIIYVPNAGFDGFDSFSYMMQAERSQNSRAKCVYVKIGG